LGTGTVSGQISERKIRPEGSFDRGISEFNIGTITGCKKNFLRQAAVVNTVRDFL